MSLFEKLKTATENKDVQSYIDLMDDDCVFVRHQSGTEMNKAQISDMLTKMVASDQTDMGQRRCIYENDDILVTHSVNAYPDGSREAVLMAYSLKNGKIVRVETGATPLPK